MSMKQFEGNLKSITDTTFGYTLTMIGGITYKTLSTQFKEMEAMCGWANNIGKNTATNYKEEYQ